MNTVKGHEENGNLIISLIGRVDTENAKAVEEEIQRLTAEYSGCPVTVDCRELTYISSSGLRDILRLKKAHPEVKLINTTPEVYEIFDMTGFTEMMTIEKAYRQVSIEGCEIIGQGSNGIVYRIDPETIVKVYKNPDSLDEIRHEREVARKALILGIPTALSYDVVQVGSQYASMFELVNAKSFTKLINAQPDKVDFYIDKYVELLKQIHSTAVPQGQLPDQREVAIGWVRWLEGHLPQDQYERILELMEAVPQSDHMIHGDYHTKNIMQQGDEIIMIDMDTLCVGNPIFEFAPIFLAYQGFGELDHSYVEDFIGIPWDTAQYFWREALKRYLGTEDRHALQQAADRASLVGYIRLLRRTIKRTPENTAQIDHCRKRIEELLPQIDSLAF